MNTLFANYCICLVASFFSRGNKKTAKTIMLFIFASVFFLHAFADINSLEDLTEYSRGFDEIEKMTIWQCLTTDVEICKMERGFAFILKLFSLMGFGFRAFLIVNALFLSFLFYKGIIKYSPSILISSILFLLIINSQSIYVIRQYIVMAIFFYSIRWIINGNIYKYLITCFACFFIHQSSIILIPVYFLYNLNLKQILAILLFSVLVLTISVNVVIDYLLSNLVGYGTYASFDMHEGQNPIGFALGMVYLVLYVYFLKRDVKVEGINKLLFICALLNVIPLYFGIGFNFAARLSIYFGSLNILLVPIMLNYVKHPLLRYTIIICCLVLNSIMTFNGSLSIESSNYRLMSFF